MEDRKPARMQKYGEIKRLELCQLYVTWLPIRYLGIFRSLDFCWTEGTYIGSCSELNISTFSPYMEKVHLTYKKHPFSCTSMLCWCNWRRVWMLSFTLPLVLVSVLSSISTYEYQYLRFTFEDPRQFRK